MHFWCIIQPVSELEASRGQRNPEPIADNAELDQFPGIPNTGARDAERFCATLGTATLRTPSKNRSGERGGSENVVPQRLEPVHELLSTNGDSQYGVAFPRGMERNGHARCRQPSDIEVAGVHPYLLRKAGSKSLWSFAFGNEG